MGITVRKAENKLTAVFSDELGRELRCDLSSLLVLGDDLNPVLNTILKPISLLRPSSIRGHLYRLNTFGEALSFLKIEKLPDTAEKWQKLVVDVHRYVLTRKSSTASLKTRISNEWLTIRSCLISLVENDIIPTSTYFPPARETLKSIDITPYKDLLLGQEKMKGVTSRDTVEKLICSISLARTDAEYLEEVRDTLTSRRRVLLDTLTKHWKHIKENFEFGQSLIKSVDWDKSWASINTATNTSSQLHPAFPNSLAGLANYLATIQYYYDGCPPSDDDFRKPSIRRQRRLIPLQKTIGSFEVIAKNLKAPDAPYSCAGWSNRNVLLWWLGRISHLDASFITALLIMLNPSWTPSSIALSSISNRDNKTYLDLCGNDLIYEVQKHRAKSMKPEHLDPLSFEIISTLISTNSTIRNQLSEKGDTRATLLFLPYGSINNKVSSIKSTSGVSYLSGSQLSTCNKAAWIGSIYPELAEAGLTTGTISHIKIRNTEGVLEWFRTKSLRAVARKLGNTEKVVLEHYIPKPLLDAWNTRIIRRFQNLWLSVASSEENFILEVTDFQTLADLHAFLRDMLKLHSALDSPLANFLHKNFSALTDQVKTPATTSAHLHVSISKGSLSALYSYQIAVIDSGLTGEALDKADIVTGLSPRHFMSLSDLLQSQIPLDKNPEFVACHNSAIKFSQAPANRQKWAELFSKELIP